MLNTDLANRKKAHYIPLVHIFFSVFDIHSERSKVISYVGTITVRREEQLRKAWNGIATSEVGKVRLTRAALSMRKSTKIGVSLIDDLTHLLLLTSKRTVPEEGGRPNTNTTSD